MGLGKTIQTIALILLNPRENLRSAGTLIIAPVSLLLQWKEEILQRIHDDYKLKVAIYHGQTKEKRLREMRQFDVVITSFGTVNGEWPVPNKYEKLDETCYSKADIEFAKRQYDLSCSEETLRNQSGPLFRQNWHRVIIDEAHEIKVLFDLIFE